MLIKVNVAGLIIDQSSNSPIVILRSENGEFTMPVWVGLLEASSIAAALQNINFDRPMTHDLFKNFMEKLDAAVTGVEIVDIIENTYYGRINFKTGGRNMSIDARPSDAVALALRFSAPIYIKKHILEMSAPMDFGDELMDKSDQGKKWAEYLDKLSKDDFGKYMI